MQGTLLCMAFLSTRALMMTSVQVVETSVNVTINCPSQDCTHPDDHTSPTYDMTPEFKPFIYSVQNMQERKCRYL